MRRAFTLVELLVVISIIALLAALLVPALSRAQFEGRSVQCQNRQKNMGALLVEYQGDHQGAMPRWPEDLTDSPTYYERDGADEIDLANTGRRDSSLTIALLYEDYAQSDTMFSCPFSDATVQITDQSELDDGVNPYTLDYDDNEATREFRFTTDSRYTETNDPDYLIDPEIPSNSSPNRAIYADGPDFSYMRLQWANDTGNPQAEFPAQRYIPHGSTVMVLFYDGHVTQLDANDRGQAANTEYPAGDSQMTDDDIYSDDANIGPRIDCHLGNYDGSNAYWEGPASDVETPFEWPWE